MNFSKSLVAIIIALTSVSSFAALDTANPNKGSHRSIGNTTQAVAAASAHAAAQQTLGGQGDAAKAVADRSAAMTANHAALAAKAAAVSASKSTISSAMDNKAALMASMQKAPANPTTSLYSGVSHRPNTGVINVAAGSLPADAPVSDDKGNIKKAGDLDPAEQVSVPHIDAIISSPNLKGGQQGHDHGGHSQGGSGNGGNNAQGTNSANAHGFGNGGAAAAGGGRQGGGFHY